MSVRRIASLAAELGILALMFLAAAKPAGAVWLVEYRTDNTQTLFLLANGTIWFTGIEGGRSLIGELDPSSGTLKRFYLTGDVELGGLALGPEFLSIGSTGTSFVWFSERRTGRIGRLNPQTGEISEWQIPNISARPLHIAIYRYGSIYNNSLFFAEQDGNRIGALSYVPASGKWVMKEFQIPTANAKPTDITVDSQGYLWFTESDASKIARFDPLKAEFQEYEVEPRSRPWGIAVDKQGFVWATLLDANRIARLDPHTGWVDAYTVPTEDSRPYYVEADADGSIWFTEQGSGKIGKLPHNATGFIEYSLPDRYAGPYHMKISKTTGDLWVSQSRRNGILRVLSGISAPPSTFTVTSTTQGASTTASAISATTATLTGSQQTLITVVTTTAVGTLTTTSTTTATSYSTLTTTQPASTVTLTKTETTTTTSAKACIIAQAAYGSELAPQVQLLREIRDRQVMATFIGSQFIRIFNRFYYSFSPQVAERIQSNPLYADLTRRTLTPLLHILRLVKGSTEMELALSGVAASALIGVAYLTIPLLIVTCYAKRVVTVRKQLLD